MITLRASPAASASTKATHSTKPLVNALSRENAMALGRRCPAPSDPARREQASEFAAAFEHALVAFVAEGGGDERWWLASLPEVCRDGHTQILGARPGVASS
jgi:hypothetical protein